MMLSCVPLIVGGGGAPLFTRACLEGERVGGGEVSSIPVSRMDLAGGASAEDDAPLFARPALGGEHVGEGGSSPTTVSRIGVAGVN